MTGGEEQNVQPARIPSRETSEGGVSWKSVKTRPPLWLAAKIPAGLDCQSLGLQVAIGI